MEKTTEQRYCKAYVRKENALGKFECKVFCVTVTVQGSHHVLTDELIAGIREQGYETHHIVSHSLQRDCL